MPHRTEQESFWAGDFGDAYTDRNRGEHLVASNIALFSRALAHTDGITSVLELGANIGLNLQALRQVLPEARLSAVEINEKAARELRTRVPEAQVQVESLLELQPTTTWDLVFTKGVLIHLHPEALPEAYDLLHRAAARYILVVEYYNPAPVEVPYRGHTGKLFKRDFAGDLLDRFADLTLVEYGFAYHRDPIFPQDDLTWFLLRKG
ncbi:MAG: pseudaminic acid biosynthesis-associated methylase [Bacteroidota bacterium]